uniref:Uncharacterized protein n=1 Tax=Alexandrium monilatum TaxID=311494 RepID=A0A7S4UPW0_9DINO|mmetsp:Transcript_32629/g.102175  ORF Transcript_32629/g.102175 Transcript_32629/m.102175 type:complete len:251 (-) Transcript_32629:29-781(-)
MGAQCNVLDKGTCCGSLRLDETSGTPPWTISATVSSVPRGIRRSKMENKGSPRPFEARPLAAGDMADAKNGELPAAEGEGDAVKEPMPKKSAILKSAIAKVRNTLAASLEEQRDFRRFLKPHFRTPGEAFEAFADGSAYIDLEHFVRKAEDLHYSGNSEKLFHSLCDGQGRISRRAFQQSLKAACNEGTFTDVVKQAMEVQKAVKRVSVVEPELSERSARRMSDSPPRVSPPLSPTGRSRRSSRHRRASV